MVQNQVLTLYMHDIRHLNQSIFHLFSCLITRMSPRLIMLSCLIVILCVISTLAVESYVNNNKKHIHIVIARYNEDLDWLCDETIQKNLANNNYKTSIYIYNKGINNVTPKFIECYENILDIHIIQLPNVGRCDHTYLYHIVDNYSALPEAIAFLPASCNMKEKIKKTQYVIEKLYKDVDTVFVNDSDVNIYYALKDFSLSSWMSSHAANKINEDASMELANPRPFGAWYIHMFGDEDKHRTSITYHGILAVSRDHIRNRDLEFYKKLLECFLFTLGTPKIRCLLVLLGIDVSHLSSRL